MSELHPDPGLRPRTCRGQPSRRNPLQYVTRDRFRALLDAPPTYLSFGIYPSVFGRSYLDASLFWPPFFGGSFGGSVSAV